MSNTYTVTTDENLSFCEAKDTFSLFHARAFLYTDAEVVRNLAIARESGVYVLFGPSRESPRRVYVGSAECRGSGDGIVNRMYETNGHQRIADWEIGIIFLCSDRNYFRDNPNRLRHLENRLWKEFDSLSETVIRVVNNSAPRDGFLSESEEEHCKKYINCCKQFLNFVGVPMCNIGIYGAQTPSRVSNVDEANTSHSILSGENTSQLATRTTEAENCMSGNEAICPPAEGGITKVCRHFHKVDGVRQIQAQVYQSCQTGRWMLCRGAFLSPLTTAGKKIKRLREDYSCDISRDFQRTLRELSFSSKNEVALFVCGTKTRNANEYWEECSWSQSLGITGAEATLLHFIDRRQGRFDAQALLGADFRHVTILRGSKIAINPPGTPSQSIIDLRQAHANEIRNGVVQNDITFTSPSSAASFVALRSCNGWKEWKNSDGISLGVIRPDNTGCSSG